MANLATYEELEGVVHNSAKYAASLLEDLERLAGDIRRLNKALRKGRNTEVENRRLAQILEAKKTEFNNVYIKVHNEVRRAESAYEALKKEGKEVPKVCLREARDSARAAGKVFKTAKRLFKQIHGFR